MTLLPLSVGDADDMVGALADPSLYVFTGGEPPTLDALRERYRRQIVGRSADGNQVWLNAILRLCDGGAAIGYVQATITPAREPDRGGAAGRGDSREPTADLAWVVSADRQRNGYAGEAASAFAAWLKTTGNPVLTAHIHPANAGSARVAERIGLVPTGELDDGEVVWSDAKPLRTTE